MRQYVEQKKRVGEAILFFRMGDFYETFYEDAVLCSKVLGIALTSRNKNSENAIPLAGIPYHALDTYLKKLVTAGYKVAISEQLEDAKQAKGVVRRDVVRIVTAGTLTEESLLTATDDNTLAAIVCNDREVGLATVELAGGRFEVVEVADDTLLDHLVRRRPAELLIVEERGSAADRIAQELHELCGTATTRRPAHEFATYQSEKSLLEHFGVSTLAGFGFDAMNASLRAAGCILQYLKETQKAALDHIAAVRLHSTDRYLQIDHSSWRALEIERTLRGGSHEGSLLHAIDRTVHPIGGRKLRHWLRAPLVNPEEIVIRQDAVAYLVDSELVRARVRRHLKNMADVERIAGRVALNRASPRDLAALGRTLEELPSLGEPFGECPVPFLKEVAGDLGGVADVAKLLRSAIRDDPPASLREGGFIADGFDAELDRLHAIGRDGRQWLADYQKRQVECTAISHLKVGFNRVFGYYIEVPNSARDRVPGDYVRRQTIKNSERYITDELKQFETQALTAKEQADQREYELFERICEQVRAQLKPLMCVADAIGRLDCVAGFAELAVQRRYVRPEMVDDGRLEIRDGRHPGLDQTLGDAFVPNDTFMDRENAWVFVVTGPNMAGKSTYIRQVALITLLAHTGSFVPASSMTFS
ncbi:MAG: DNA mismatch repair protein MutS, partial [Planctomycetes bacterium]|nr:DNA mismatch repair protein MutS [Planctomycetota bacterium]